MQRIVSLIHTATSIGTLSTVKNSIISSSVFTPVNKVLLAPLAPTVNQVCGFKVKGRVNRRCEACYLVLRDGRMYNICPKHPRHKQMAMRPKLHNTWILTHASQSKVRPW